METLLTFFDGYTSGELMNMLVVAVLFAVPQFGVKAINAIKEHFGLEGHKAQTLFLFSLTVVALGTMFVTGQITEINFTLKTFLSTFAAALVPAKVAYKAFVKGAG